MNAYTVELWTSFCDLISVYGSFACEVNEQTAWLQSHFVNNIKQQNYLFLILGNSSFNTTFYNPNKVANAFMHLCQHLSLPVKQ